MITPPDDPNFEFNGHRIDLRTGYVIDKPLGPQVLQGYFAEHPEELQRVLELREAEGIVVDDDYLVRPEVTIADGSTDQPEPLRVAPRKGPHKIKRGRAGGTSAKARTLSLELKLDGKSAPGVFPAQLRRYWLGEGLSRWATTPTPYRSLVAALRSEDVPARMVQGLAARLYHWHFGKWPGARGKKSWELLGYTDGGDL